jgi:hypothetical protein
MNTTSLLPLSPSDFFQEVRIGDFLVLTPEGLRYFVIDLHDDPYNPYDPYDPFKEKKIVVWGACRGGMLRVRLSTYTTFIRDKEGEYHSKEMAVIWAQRCQIDVERVMEVLRLSPGSWMMQRPHEQER